MVCFFFFSSGALRGDCRWAIPREDSRPHPADVGKMNMSSSGWCPGPDDGSLAETYECQCDHDASVGRLQNLNAHRSQSLRCTSVTKLAYTPRHCFVTHCRAYSFCGFVWIASSILPINALVRMPCSSVRWLIATVPSCMSLWLGSQNMGSSDDIEVLCFAELYNSWQMRLLNLILCYPLSPLES